MFMLLYALFISFPVRHTNNFRFDGHHCIGDVMTRAMIRKLLYVNLTDNVLSICKPKFQKFPNYGWFPWNICNGCGMSAGNAYPFGHLVPSPILGLANAPIVETKFLELSMSLFDFSPRIPLGTFSILLLNREFFLVFALE